MKRTVTAIDDLPSILEMFKNLSRHPENINTVKVGTWILESINKRLPAFEIHIVGNEIIQNHDVFMWLYKILLTETPYRFCPKSNSFIDSKDSVEINMIYNNRSLVHYVRRNPDYLDVFREVYDNFHKYRMPYWVIAENSLESYLGLRNKG